MKPKTQEDLAKEWLDTTFDESELQEHERSSPSVLAVHKAMAGLGFHYGCRSRDEEVEKLKQEIEHLERELKKLQDEYL